MLFSEITITIVLASLLGMLMMLFKQPSILGYIIAGAVIGFAGFVSSQSLDVVNALSSVGIALLLFMVGLEMNLDKVKHLGWDIVLLGSLQTICIVSAGFLLVKLIGFAFLPAIYISFGLSFSSTIIVVKLLSEKRDLNSLYGRLVVGSMVFEDFLAIFMLIFLEGVAAGAGSFSLTGDFAITFLKGLTLFVATVFLSRFMPKIVDYLGGKSETLFLFSLAWGLGIALLMDTKLIGLGIVIGGFLAGLSLASSAERYEISGRIRWIRDFFILLFFVALGSQMGFDLNREILLKAGILSGFVLIASPIISILLMSLLGYKSRTAFFASLSTAQISEFSLVVAMKGASLNHLTANDVSVMVIVAIVTITISSYYVLYSDNLFKFFKKPLKLLELKHPHEDNQAVQELSEHIILIGGHRLGQNIIRSLIDIGESFLVVDFDPQIVKSLRDQGLSVVYGDVAEDDVREAAEFSKARLIISTAPSFEDNAVVLEAARRENPKIKIILRAENDNDAKELYGLGADYVLLPYFLGGEYLGRMLEDDKSCHRLLAVKKRDLKSLANRCP